LKAPDFIALKLKYDKLIANVGFNFTSRLYMRELTVRLFPRPKVRCGAVAGGC
jgi:hypothetical protein